MADMVIAGLQRGRRPRTTTPDTAASRSPDLVDRRFIAERSDELWVTDITYVSTSEGWMYVTFVLDAYSRVIVGWRIASHLRTEVVLDAIEMAIWQRDTSTGLTCHWRVPLKLDNYKLPEWEGFYNFSQPHGGFGRETPYERLGQKTKLPTT